jgi:hypothetical protein
MVSSSAKKAVEASQSARVEEFGKGFGMGFRTSSSMLYSTALEQLYELALGIAAPVAYALPNTTCIVLKSCIARLQNHSIDKVSFNTFSVQ